MNIIRNSLRLARKDLKILFKDKGQLAVLFVLPFILALFLGSGGIGNKKLASPIGESRLSIQTYIVNEDQGPYGALVEDVLRDIQPLQIIRSSSFDRADKLVADGEAAAAIIIPADFSTTIDSNQPTIVKVIKDPTRQTEAQAVTGILKEVLTEFNVRAEIEYGIRAVYEKTGALQGADPNAVLAAQVTLDDAVRHRDEGLVRALAALHPRLAADPCDPLVGAGWRVAGAPRLGVLPADREHVHPPCEQVTEEGHLRRRWRDRGDIAPLWGIH